MSKVYKAFFYLFSSIRTILFLVFRYNKNLMGKGYKKYVLLLSRDMSMSGAPLVLMDIAKYFEENDYEVILMYKYDGRLRHECNYKKFCTFFFQAVIQKLVINCKFDCIFVNTIANCEWISYFEKNNIKYNLWIHEGDEYFSKYYKRLPNKLQNCRIFSVSDICEVAIEKYGFNYNSIQMPYPYEYSRKVDKYDFAKAKKIILIVGSICKRKNQMELIKALDLLNEDLKKDIKVLIVGSSIDKEYSKKLIKSTMHINFVEYIDYLDHNKLMDLYNDIYLSVCCSTDDPLPVTITEAIFAHRLVLVSSGTGHYEYIQNNINGFTYNVNDIYQLAKRIEEILNLSPEKYLEITDKAYISFEKKFDKNSFYDILNSNLLRCS